jgi:hypothetical protein
LARLNIGRAGDAERRIKERNEPANGFKFCEGSHNSTRRAGAPK